MDKIVVFLLLFLLTGCVANPVKSSLNDLRVNKGYTKLHDQAKAEIFKYADKMPLELKKAKHLLLYYLSPKPEESRDSRLYSVLFYDLNSEVCYAAQPNTERLTLNKVDLHDAKNTHYKFIIDNYSAGNLALINKLEWDCVFENVYNIHLIYDIDKEEDLVFYFPFLSCESLQQNL